MLQPTGLEQIRAKVLAYYDKMQEIAAFLKKNNAPDRILIDPQKEFLQFYIDKEAITRLNHITSLAEFDSFGVYFGLNEGFDSVTACFVGLDKNKNLLPDHKDTVLLRQGRELVKGEDTWPPSGGNRRDVQVNDEKDLTLCTPRWNIFYQLG